jgi:hypothetical protein
MLKWLTYTITPVKAGCEGSPSYIEEKHKWIKNMRTMSIKTDPEIIWQIQTLHQKQTIILPYKSLRGSFYHIRILSSPNTTKKIKINAYQYM